MPAWPACPVRMDRGEQKVRSVQAAVRRQATQVGPGTGEWRHHMNHVLGAVAAVAPPQNAKQLLETLARIWADKPGGRTRQIQIQSTAALLRWAVAERRLGEDLEPPQELAVFVGRSRAAKAITTPLEVEPILALVRAIPDASWRFAFPLMAAYGLRPVKRQHLQIRQGRLWCMDEKVACCGKARPRVLRPLPCDDWADGGRLEERFPTQELPPMQPGLGGGYGGHYLMNRPLWKVLRPEYEAKGEKVEAARWAQRADPPGGLQPLVWG